MHKPIIAAALLALLLSCGDEAAQDLAQPGSAALFGPEITTIALEVDYMTGAEPFTGSAGNFNDIWDLYGDNAERMFAAGADKTILFPNVLDEMEELTDVEGESFDVAAILAIAEAHRDDVSAGDRATFYALWLDGFFRDDSGERRDVLGVSIGNTGVIAMFKPVIDSTGNNPLLRATERFVEQTTLIHEFGHAVGLVNRGVPLTSAHHDEPNGAHCTNRDCVMFFANEGASGLFDFIVDFFTSGETVVFGDECLADMDAIIEASQP